MRIKAKLTLGIGLLFMLIVLLALVGTKYIHALADDTKNILVANYNTLEYSRNILIALDEKADKEKVIASFERNLVKQQSNVTEVGEQEITDQLASHFDKYKKVPGDVLLELLIRQDIYNLMKLNMDAIQRKSKMADETAKNAVLWIALTGTLCFLIAFTLLLNFPGAIANPIKELTASIRQIADKNYSERVHFESHDEFGDLASAFNTMAAKLEEYDNSNLSKILFEKKRIETLINNMPDPIIGLDEKRKILFANNEALKILNIDEKNLVGKYAQDVSLTNDLMRSLTKDLVQSDQVKENREPLKIYADNKESYFEKEIIHVTITPTGESESRHIGDVIILQNITVFKELDFAKTNFIAIVSHELKTPLSSILISLKLLEDERVGKINKEQQELIHHVKEDSERLLKITGELLNMTQVETGKIQINIKATDPKEIIHYALEATKTQVENSKTDLEIISPANLPLILADSEKSAWVLTNFISNAIRYSPEGSRIIVNISLKEHYIEFSVQDFGKGIDEKYKDKIFERYFQIPGSDKAGTGLGLSICKEFIETQRGKIWLKSEVGTGSIFYFTLPKA